MHQCMFRGSIMQGLIKWYVLGWGGGEGELSCDLSSPVCGDTGKNNWKHSSLSTAQKMKHSVYLPVFA